MNTYKISRSVPCVDIADIIAESEEQAIEIAQSGNAEWERVYNEQEDRLIQVEEVLPVIE